MVPVTEMQEEIEEAKRMERYIQLAGEHARDNRGYDDGYSERSNLSFHGNQSQEGSLFGDGKKAEVESNLDSLEFDEKEPEINQRSEKMKEGEEVVKEPTEDNN
jgi:hypothetical protein